MSLIKDINILTEVKMSDTELFKPNSTTGEERVDILLGRINNNEPLELEVGGEIVVDKVKSKDFITSLKSKDEDKIREVLKTGNKYNDVIIAKDGKEYKITALKKAAYFGGAGGTSRSDAQKTAWQESAQAMAFGIAINYTRTIDAKDLTSAEIKKAKSFYDVDSSIDQAMEIISQPQWNKSIVNTVNEVRKDFKLTGMVAHRGSSWVKALEDKFNEVNKDEKGRVFPGKDKWNPSDIWLVKKGVKVPSEINDLVELNAWLQKMFEEKKVIGISLKLTPKNTKSKIYNFDDDLDDLLKISIQQLLISKTNELFKSKEGQIIFESITPLSQRLEEDAFVVRSFKTQDNVSGEISGRYAAGGKIGFGPVNRILRKLKLKEITHRKDLAEKLDKKNKKNKVKYYSKLLDEIIELAAVIDKDVAANAKKNLKDIAKDIDFNRLASKYQAVQTLATIKKASKAKQRDFIQQAIQYASSRSDLSSVFVKVW